MKFKPWLLVLTPLAIGNFVFCATGFVAADDQDEEGKLIQVEPDRTDETAEANQVRPQPRVVWPGVPVPEPTPVSKYWIGVHGGPLTPELKAHVVLPDGEGVLIRSVEPNSPALKGGIKAYDVLTHINGKPLNSVKQLVEAVGEQGELKGRLAIDLMRACRTETVWVTPEERPIRVNPLGPFQDLDQFGIQPGFKLHQFNNGISISIRQQGDGPAKISVKRGDESWEIEGDHPEALAALPEDIRPQVERMLDRQRARNPLNGRLREHFQLNDRLRELEQEAEEIRRNLMPSLEAPRQQAGEVDNGEPTELEIPAE